MPLIKQERATRSVLRPIGPPNLFFRYLSLFSNHFLTARTFNSTRIISSLLKFVGFSVVFLFLSSAAVGQNTKGDKPVKNQRQVKETRGKSVKKKSKGSSRDIANRRLRTKNQSSSNRANSTYRQSSPYSNRGSKQERAATPRGRTFSQSPREGRTQGWKGDVSGHKIRTVKPSRSDAARTNVYPQTGPYVRYARKQPKKRPPVYSRTIKGTKFVEHKPRAQERAWKGGVDRGPIKNQSATGSFKNTYSQKGPYVKYYRKNLKSKDQQVSNKWELGTVKSMSRKPLTGGSEGTLYPASASRPFLKRGKKNVYWGKFSKKEKPFLKDLTGGPLRTKNFRTAPGGLTGRDTLQFFGKRPAGDRANRVQGGGYVTSGGREKGWKGDLAGWRLRRSAKGRKEVAGKFFFPRKLSISGTRERAGKKVQGSGFSTLTKKGEQAELNSISAIVYSRDLSGKVKKGVKPPKKGGGSIKGLWNNSNQSIAGKGFGGSYRAARYTGNLKRGQGFTQQGIDYSGRINRNSVRGFQTDGVNYSGRIKRSSLRGFSTDGVNYSGRIKRSSIRGFSTEGVDYSGRIKRNSVRGFQTDGVNYSGRIKRSSIRGFSTEGVDYSGRIKRNSVRGFQNDGVNYSGRIKRSSVRGFSPQGVDYSGRIPIQRPKKGGGSISGGLWNNNNRPIDPRSPGSDMGGRYSGNIKVKRPQKGGGSVSGKLWNNEGKAIDTRTPGSDMGGRYSGNIKVKRPEKGGGSVSGKLWNNNNQPLNTSPKGNADVNYSGKIARSRFKKDYIQNPNSSKESLKKKRPDETTYKVEGLQVKVHEGNYKTKPLAAKYSLRGIAPSKASVKASEYSSSMKQYWKYKHNPNSAKDALKLREPGKADYRIADYQGNVKMHKYNDKRLHPDSKFAHGYRDNVKEERTILMNVKLMWARLFRKSETQPDNLKEKITKPKYDKREKGMWND
ncbi:hypothetical protein BH09BAC3_BH09BAC3_03800 [soil metagenome]